MKFLCSNCKAKYQIPDEKIAGRTLKMDCRRCSTPIVIRGDLGLPDDAEELVTEAQDPRGGARPAAGAPAAGAAGARRPAPAGRPLGAGGGSSVGPHPQPSARSSGRSLGADFRRNVASAAEPPRPVTPLDQWHVAINDVPVGPMKRDEIARKIGAGAVSGDSLAWREGFDDWRPLREIPELAALMRRAQAESDRPPRGAPVRGAAPRAPAPAPRAVSNVRPGAAAAPASARPAARSNVVPIGGRLGASAAPALDPDDLLDGESPDGSESVLGDSEPTTVASAADLGLAGFGNFSKDGRAKNDFGPLAKSAPESTAIGVPDPLAGQSSKGARAEPAKPAAKPASTFKPLAAPVGLAVPPKPAAAAEPAPEPRRPSFAPPPPEAAPVAAAAFSPPVAPAVVSPERPRAGLPIGALMGIGFAMAAGAVLMFALVQRFILAPVPPPVAATTTVAPTVATPETPHVAPVDVEPVAPEATTPEDPPTPTTSEATAPTTGATPPPTDPPHHTGAHTATKAPTTAATPTTPTTSSRFSQFADDSSGGPAPITTGSSTTRQTDGPSAPRTELTEAQISEVRRREQRSLQACWETAIRGMRDVGDVRMDIDITIGASGTVTSARARGPGVGTLSDCIEQRVRRWHFPASSEPTQLTFPVVFSGQ